MLFATGGIVPIGYAAFAFALGVTAGMLLRGGHPGLPGSNFAACQASLTKFHLQELINYQPISRFWEFQWLETGIFVAVAVALAACCIWWPVPPLTGGGTSSGPPGPGRSCGDGSHCLG